MTKPFLPVPDADTQRVLEHQHAAWRRIKYGAAAIGCALVLGACGGGDDPAPEQDVEAPPVKVPRPDCAAHPEECR